MLVRLRIRRSFATLEKQLETPYGNLVNIKRHPAEKQVIDEIQILKDESAGRIMHYIEKQSKYFMFDNKVKYDNTVKFHNAVKARFLQKFAGTKKHPKTLYGKSQNPRDIFHYFRRMQNEINKGLSRLGYHMFKDGTLNLHGDVPECNLLIELIKEWRELIPKEVLGTSFAQPDYFISVPLYHEILSGAELEKGIKYSLNSGEDILFKGTYGVSMPFQDHFEMLDMFTERFLNNLNDKSILDFETNTAVLSAYMRYKGASKVIKYDSNKYAFKALELNIKSLGLDKRGLAIERTQKNVEGEYDVVLCMPPLLHCTYIKSDNDFANIYFDPKAKILRRCFESASNLFKQ